MSQLATNVAPSVVDKGVNESEIRVENKSQRSSEETVMEKEEGQKKRSFMDKIRGKSNNPPVPPKAAKKSKPILENKTEVEVVPKITAQKSNVERDENLKIKEATTTEPAANLVNVSERMPEPAIPLVITTQEDDFSSENEISKQALTEPQIDTSVILENPTEMQIEPSSVTNITLPTSLVLYANEAKTHNGTRKDTRTPSYTNLSRRSSVSSSTSRSSLGVSAAPSSSSMCHLTELAQPTTVRLQSTLARLRRLHANTERVQQHLRDLRNRPTLRAKKSSSDTNINRSSRTTGSKSLAATTGKSVLFDLPVYEKLANRMFDTLESKLTVKNAAEHLILPMESDYYRAAYAGLARIWGQPYTKCSLELHQHLAAELGLLAETFVMDSTRGMSLVTLQPNQKNGIHLTS